MNVLLYRRYVDDTFSLNVTKNQAVEFLTQLNNLHPALEFTCKNETYNKLPFMDVLVIKTTDLKRSTFNTTVYRKPTFTGQYVRWDSFSAKRCKINLILGLTNRS